jgi:hypothetical protein
MNGDSNLFAFLVAVYNSLCNTEYFEHWREDRSRLQSYADPIEVALVSKLSNFVQGIVYRHVEPSASILVLPANPHCSSTPYSTLVLTKSLM